MVKAGRPKKPSARTRYVSNLMQAPLRPARSVKQIASQAGIYYLTAARIEKEIAEQAITPTGGRQIYWPRFPELGKRRVQAQTARSGLVEELVKLISENPVGRLPTKKLGEKYRVSRVTVTKLAERIRKELRIEGKPKRGGPNFAYPQNVLEILLKRMKGKQPVNIKDLILEIAEKTGEVLSPLGIYKFYWKRGIKAEVSGIPTIKGRYSFKSSLKLLAQRKTK